MPCRNLSAAHFREHARSRSKWHKPKMSLREDDLREDAKQVEKSKDTTDLWEPKKKCLKWDDAGREQR